MGGKNVTPTDDIVDSIQDIEALNKARSFRKRFNFGILGIDEGTILQFKKDKNITCKVASDTSVEFREQFMSLSRSADIVLKELGYDWASVQGTAFWCLNGKSLNDMRLEME